MLTSKQEDGDDDDDSGDDYCERISRSKSGHWDGLHLRPRTRSVAAQLDGSGPEHEDGDDSGSVVFSL